MTSKIEFLKKEPLKSILLGIIAALSFLLAEPPSCYVFLLFIGFPIVFHFIDSKEKYYYWIWGIGLLKSLVSMFWLKEVGYYFIPWIGVSIYMSLWWLLFALLAGLFRKKGICFFVFAPFLWIVLDYLRSYGELGFPWLFIGYGFYDYPRIRQFADISGVYGLSFLAVLATAFVHEILHKKYILAVPLIAMLIALPAYGHFKRKKAIPETPRKNIALVQANMDSRVPWTSNNSYKYAYKSYLTYAKMLSAISSDTDWIVLPETAIPYYIIDEDFFHWFELFKELAIEKRNIYILGIASQIGNRHYNSAVYMDRDGIMKGIYSKKQLVPFGEFIPKERYIGIVKKVLPKMPYFSHGDRSAKLKPDSIYVGCFICYEIIFPDMVREEVTKGASVLVNLTNDIWFGFSSGPYQHAAIAVFRAIENGRYLVRCANSGISLIADPYGNIQIRTRIMEQVTAYGYIIPLETRTIYSRTGAFIFPVSLFFLVLVYAFKKGLKKES